MEAYNKRIGYIGIGNMGSGIARNLLKKGFDVRVYSRRPEAMAPFATLGAKTSTSMKELVENVDHIFICVGTDKDVTDVITGNNGILEHARPGQMIIVQSTCMISTIEEVEAAATAKGVGLIDAPVSGNFEDRENGTLAIYVGGKAPFVEECRPALDAMGANGEKVVYLGEAGNGELGKLINNQIGITVASMVQQMMTVARAYGLSEQQVLDITEIGTGKCWATWTWPYFDALLPSHQLGPAMCRLGCKDLLDAQAAALRKGVGLPIADVFCAAVESIQCERAEYLARRDGGFTYQVDQVTTPPHYKIVPIG